MINIRSQSNQIHVQNRMEENQGQNFLMVIKVKIKIILNNFYKDKEQIEIKKNCVK